MTNLDDIPRVPLVHQPTPLHPLPRLSREAANGVQVWCKRDDLTWLALGGNKLRKLEFLLRDALDQGADTVITTGAAQSNHARLTAAAATSLGLRPVLVLRRPVVGPTQGNLLLDDLLGAEVRFGEWATWEEGARLLEEVAAELRAAGRHPYIIPMGGSNALGALGYVVAAREIAQQAEALGIEVSTLLCVTSSGATQAGLLLGQRLFRLPFQVIGVAVSEATAASEVARLASEAAALLEAEPVPEEAVLLLRDYIGPGYGRVDGRTVEAVRLVARLEGVLVDPVYTGKAMAGLLDQVRKGRWQPGEAVVFLHTGGIPALFAYGDALNVRVGIEEP